MAELSEIVSLLDDNLRIEEYIEDSSWNGLQVEGKEEVKKIIFMVDAGLEPFERAIDENADMIVVHHGIFWKNGNPSLRGEMKERAELLLKNNVSLYAAHLPLDKHDEVGNNVRLLKIIGARVKESFDYNRAQDIGKIGVLDKEKNLGEIVKEYKERLKTNAKVLNFGKEKVKTVAVCSGGGGYAMFYKALEKKVDLYITGDTIEVYHAARDAKMNVIFLGHHASETVGLKALEEVIRKKFDVETKFIDIETGL